jgi:DnaK suppressor protein
MVRPRSALDLVATERPADALAARLPALRAVLEEQCRFRREQLAQLGGTARDGQADDRDSEAVPALREVDDIVAAGARRALADIELALLRMSTGRYGVCRSCDAPILLALLEAIPRTTLCLACQLRNG